MKFYHSPGTCSQGVHIALHEAQLSFEPIKVDLKTHSTERDGDFTAINAKAYVPALVMDDGQLLTENVAILSWIAESAPQLAPGGTGSHHRDAGFHHLGNSQAFHSTVFPCK